MHVKKISLHLASLALEQAGSVAGTVKRGEIMSGQQRSRMCVGLPNACESRVNCYLPRACGAARGAFAAASFMAASFIGFPKASAAPPLPRQARLPLRLRHSISQADAFRLLIVQLWVTFVPLIARPFAAAVTSEGAKVHRHNPKSTTTILNSTTTIGCGGKS